MVKADIMFAQETKDSFVSQTLERNGQPVSLDTIYQPIRHELGRVEALIAKSLSSDLPWVSGLLEHSRALGGKRMRPVFVLLAGGCAGSVSDAHVAMAASLEIIHTASLIHDDVLDRAETRRHAPTINAKWDNKVSVLLGDFLFTQAFCVAAESKNPRAIGTLAQASSRVCAGEMRQNAWVGNYDLNEADYIGMISEKTGELVGCGCRLGAILSDASEEMIQAFDQFGQDLGIAFQIIDDILDLVGAQSKVGKTLGTDILNQKPTLPVIHALRTLAPTDRQALLDRLEAGDLENVLGILSKSESIDYARETAARYATNAMKFANSLEPSSYAAGLKGAAQFILQRSH